jgi:hypothetical protein
MNDRDWRVLLRLMRDGLVVPVIGSRLVLDNDGTSSLYAKVARKLLADHGVELGDEVLPPFRELNAAVTRLVNGELKGRPEKIQDVYGDVYSALGELHAEGSSWRGSPTSA